MSGLVESDYIYSAICIAITILVYLLVRKLTYFKIIKQIPLVISISAVIVVLIELSGVSYQSYVDSTYLIGYMLAPATVALALPFYECWALVKENLLEIAVAVVVSAVVSIASILLFCVMLGIDEQIYLSFIGKCVTTPVCIELTKISGGILGLSVCAVTVSGLSGIIFGHKLLSIMGIKSDISIGLSIGSISHVVGTSKCLEISQKQAAFSALVLVLCAIFTSIIISVYFCIFSN